MTTEIQGPGTVHQPTRLHLLWYRTVPESQKAVQLPLSARVESKAESKWVPVPERTEIPWPSYGVLVQELYFTSDFISTYFPLPGLKPSHRPTSLERFSSDPM